MGILCLQLTHLCCSCIGYNMHVYIMYILYVISMVLVGIYDRVLLQQDLKWHVRVAEYWAYADGWHRARNSTEIRFENVFFRYKKKKTKVKHCYFVVGRARNKEMRREKRIDAFKRFRFNFTKYYIFGYYNNTLLYGLFFPLLDILFVLSWTPIYSNEDFMLFKL